MTSEKKRMKLSVTGRVQGVGFRNHTVKRARQLNDVTGWVKNESDGSVTVVAEGRLDVYEERGNYQLIVEDMQKEGAGALEQEFEELKQKLEEEGALDRSRKRELPFLPETIGVVTSGDGAAFWDIAHPLERRCPIVRLVLYPSRVNGRDAAGDIVHGIERLPEIADLDVLIVGRGGGSPEDLWGFNTEEVARAVEAAEEHTGYEPEEMFEHVYEEMPRQLREQRRQLPKDPQVGH